MNQLRTLEMRATDLPNKEKDACHQAASASWLKLYRAQCSSSNSAQTTHFVHFMKMITQKDYVYTGSELQAQYATTHLTQWVVCKERWKIHKMTKILRLMRHQTLGRLWTCINTRKKHRRKNPRSSPKRKMIFYNIRSKRNSPTLGEMKQKLKLLRKVDPLAVQRQKTKSKPEKIMVEKSTSMRKKNTEHSIGKHEHQSYLGHLGESTHSGLQYCGIN